MRAAFHTLGCKVNSYETRAISEQFENAGYEIVDFTEPSDVYVINTCSVTSMAEHKSRQMIHRARRLNPGAVIVAAGCYAQRAEGDIKDDGSADIIIGNNNKSHIIDAVAELLKERQGSEDAQGREYVDDLMQCRDYESQIITGFGENVRAYVKIQDGCNRFCSYCIIPYIRGRSRCRKEEDILSEIRGLAANGYREIVLTGIDISMYDGMPSLIEKTEAVDGIERIRLGSLEAGVITDEFIETASKSRKLCPHFHLSLQSGCAATLKRMNRHYTPSEYAEKVRLIREKIKECAITTDVIVGFPGETDEEFEESLSFVKQMGFTQTHVFKYSRRAGTVADRMPDQVPEKVKNERSARLIKVTDEMNLGAAESFIGRTVPVLIEEKEKAADGECLQCGFTPQYIRAGVESGSDLINTIVMLKVSGMAQTENGRVLTGKIEKNLQ
ncbi:MAG: tRNA (N(6)-L-threonylcarbamoyladenosine(37)-C(2))-methylthiotransferase MtaB [Lachnospiraceae bacterium]|nr:tRNA (N(6)-L-threonylcarbamoyladenosine(37)-C(2))-methylthiotransferase MtaB [Lachnospiraceae bacterium]